MRGHVKTLTWAAIAGLSALAAARPVAAQTASEHLYGPAPPWEEFRRLAEADIRAQLIDPESARFTWAGSYYRGELKVLLGARTQGYVGCGTVNSRNRMGGYVGATPFAIVIDYGRVLYSQIDRPIGYDCVRLQQAGKFPPLPDGGEASSPAASNAVGLALRPMPEGAYVSAVVPGSVAAAAGIKPGMLIASINAIPLAGMDEAMLAVINAAGPGATLTMVGGTSFKLGGKP